MIASVARDDEELMTTILFAGGGSGGHLFPGIAVAEELARRNPRCECVFAGSKRPIEAQILGPRGFRHWGLDVPASSSFFRSPLRAAKSFWRAYQSAAAFIEESNPRLVVGLGGSFSVPTVLAASRRSVPIILLEQNAVLGRANRMLLRFADHVCLSFAKTPLPSRYRPITSITGNPVRSQILAAKSQDLKADRSGLLILGGSQGARAVNGAVLGAFARLRPMLAGWRIIHQTGAEELEVVRSGYAGLGVSATVLPFFEDMGAIYSQTALAFSRAGGTTLAELAAHSVPSVLIPYPGSVRDHQALNARQYADAGGAVAIPQRGDLNLTIESLCEVLPPLLTHPNLRSLRGKAMFSLASPDASQKVADLALRYCSHFPPSSVESISQQNLARAS